MVQIMACRLLVPSHYLDQCWFIVNQHLRNKFQWNFNQNKAVFIRENKFEKVVCKMATILAWTECVNCMSIFNKTKLDPQSTKERPECTKNDVKNYFYSRIPLSRAPLTRENQLVALDPWTPNFSDAPLATAHMTGPVTHMCWSEQILHSRIHRRRHDKPLISVTV